MNKREMMGFEKNKKKFGKQKGFTLVEVLVSVSIFLLATMAIMQMFFFAGRVHRKLLAQTQLAGEASYIMENISRSVRVAKKVLPMSATACGDIAGGENYKSNSGNHIKFQNQNADNSIDCVEYYQSTRVAGYGSNSALMVKHTNPLPLTSNFDLPLTSPQVNVAAFRVIGFGWPQTDGLQSRTTFYLKLEGKEGAVFESQFTVSMRDLDLDMSI